MPGRGSLGHAEAEPPSATTSTSVTSSSSSSLHLSPSASESCTLDDSRLTSCIPNKDLTKLLECPVCYEIPLPPFLMCTAGHNTCSQCRKKCTTCPVCRSGFCDTRNLFVENIVDQYSLQCRYLSSGCTQALGGRMMAKHVEICEFR